MKAKDGTTEGGVQDAGNDAASSVQTPPVALVNVKTIKDGAHIAGNDYPKDFYLTLPKDQADKAVAAGLVVEVKASAPADDVPVKILKHGAEIGGFTYAANSIQTLPADRANKAVELGLAEIVVL